MPAAAAKSVSITIPASERTKDNSYASQRTALLFVDPYNDFLSEGGKLWPLLKDVATETGHLDNLRTITAAIRQAGIPIFIVPHRRWEPGDYENWEHPSPYQAASGKAQVFARGSWGGEWHPDFAPQHGDIVVKEHWGGSGFANPCIETTSRFAMELGYHVTLVKDATAAFTREMMHSAHELNGPTFAHRILTSADLIALLPRRV